MVDWTNELMLIVIFMLSTKTHSPVWGAWCIIWDKNTAFSLYRQILNDNSQHITWAKCMTNVKICSLLHIHWPQQCRYGNDIWTVYKTANIPIATTFTKVDIIMALTCWIWRPSQLLYSKLFAQSLTDREGYRVSTQLHRSLGSLKSILVSVHQSSPLVQSSDCRRSVFPEGKPNFL